MFADFIFAVSTMIFCFSSDDSMEVSPVEPMISTALVPCCSWKASRLLNAAKSTDPSLLNGVISATNEPVIFCLAIQRLRLLLPPPCGEGWGGGREATTSVDVSIDLSTPTPAPPHKGEG